MYLVLSQAMNEFIASCIKNYPRLTSHSNSEFFVIVSNALQVAQNIDSCDTAFRLHRYLAVNIAYLTLNFSFSEAPDPWKRKTLVPLRNRKLSPLLSDDSEKGTLKKIIIAVNKNKIILHHTTTTC